VRPKAPVRSRASATCRVRAPRGVGVPNRHVGVCGRPPSIAASSRLQPAHASRNPLSQASIAGTRAVARTCPATRQPASNLEDAGCSGRPKGRHRDRRTVRLVPMTRRSRLSMTSSGTRGTRACMKRLLPPSTSDRSSNKPTRPHQHGVANLARDTAELEICDKRPFWASAVGTRSFRRPIRLVAIQV
jgi:hypothetical protein